LARLLIGENKLTQKTRQTKTLTHLLPERVCFIFIFSVPPIPPSD
jgi:hypothetical protein